MGEEEKRALGERQSDRKRRGGNRKEIKKGRREMGRRG